MCGALLVSVSYKGCAVAADTIVWECGGASLQNFLTPCAVALVMLVMDEWLL